MSHPSLAKPIVVPTNPFWKVLCTFGRDEFYAGLISIAVTALIEGIFYLWNIPPGVGTLLVLSFAGPIFEKFGFFIGHFNDARKVYAETPEAIRKTRKYYLRQAFRGGFKSLIEDILVHDPIYVGLMFGGMWFHPSTPAWLLVPIAFGVAVLLVAVLEVGFHEIRYWYFKRHLFGLGFESETYLESRFYIERDADADAIINQLRDQFFPRSDIRTLQYHDAYLENGCQELPEFNARSSKIRIRTRTDARGGWVNTVQVIYSRTVESSGGTDQFRYFPKKKDKLYLMLAGSPCFTGDGESCDRGLFSHYLPRQVQDFIAYQLCKKVNPVCLPQSDHAECVKPTRVDFIRKVVNDRTLFISIDTVNDSYHVVEIKVYPQHSKKMKEAMRYVMYQFPVIQITHGKADLEKKHHQSVAESTS